jgi:glycosyltransferase domain-containing protein
MDGTDIPISNSELSQLANNIHYFHAPYSISQRLKMAAEKITSKYVILMGDDEFYIPSALESCVNFLEENPDYVSCGGQVMAFNIDHSKVIGWSIYDEIIDRQVLFDDPAKRLEYHCMNYVPNAFFSVTRRESWCEAYRAHIDQQINFYASGELQFQMTIATLGKIKTLNELLWLRSYEAERIFGTDPALNNSVSFRKWWERHTQDNDFVENTLRYMPVTKIQLITSIKKYIYKRNKKIKFIKKIKYFLINFILPPKLYEKLRVNLGQKMTELLNCANFYLSKNISVDINALIEIKSHIEAFHATKKRRYGK